MQIFTRWKGSDTLLQNNQFYFYVWFTLSLINAGLAQTKNRSGLNWFFISMILGPVATLIIINLSRKD
ncbi:hypothetical protein [Paenibacillus sp. IHBB 10380]|uniref:hypothetical protein n=1 Tax=Paenibacillus sp. IHBB 10380 TaxID=1566358 RepID=UPI0009E2150A|nr:hypothetical protein [Paenibacillus sp. IHBB 10380]